VETPESADYIRKLLSVCISAARAAGDHAVRHKPRRNEIHEKFAHDIKLKLDQECQVVAEAIILEQFPGHTILGEERSETGHSSVEWIIDPIDGTVNYFHGLTWWCSSVAVRVDGVIVAGAVYAPEVLMLFTATSNGPACLNDKPINVSTAQTLSEVMVVTGSEKELNPDFPPLATAQLLAPHVQKIRILGAAALDICQVASGAVDVFFQNGLYIWDVAAAGLIVERAGGVYLQSTTHIPGRYACMAAANPALIQEIEGIVAGG